MHVRIGVVTLICCFGLVLHSGNGDNSLSRKRRQLMDWQSATVYLTESCSHTITNTNYPNGYDYDSSWRWDIVADPERLILVTFTDVQLDTQSCETYVELTDDYETELNKYCGAPMDMPEAIMTPGSLASITFMVGFDYQEGQRGFKAEIRAFKPLEKIMAPTPSPTTPTTGSTTVSTTQSSSTLSSTTTASSTTTTTTTAAGGVVFNDPTFRCGVPTTEEIKQKLAAAAFARIIAGEPSVPGEFPWMLQLRYRHIGAICGATLISPRFAIGALHCFAGAETSEQTYEDPSDAWTVAAGAYYRQNSYNVTSRKIKKVHIHPNVLSNWGNRMDGWTPSSGQGDIAVLELDQPLYPSENISYMCMPRDLDYGTLTETTQQQQTVVCRVSGWGVTQVGVFPRDSLALQRVRVTLVEHQLCVDWYKQDFHTVSDDMFCAANLTRPGDSCQGDSGGPIQCRIETSGDAQYELAGVVSWGISCGDTKRPGVYTNTFYYLDWIKEIVGNDPLFYKDS